MQTEEFERARGDQGNDRAAEIHELWQRFVSERDLASRNRLAAIYYPLAKNIARMMARSLAGRAELGDLQSFAAEGLLGAIERFEPGRGMEFPAFAAYRIRYAVLDGVRSADWVPRSVRERERRLRSVEEESFRNHGRSPHEHEEAEELALSVEELRKVKTLTSRTNISSIHALSDPSRGTGEVEIAGDEPDPMATVIEADVVRLLREGVDRLPERQRDVIIWSLDGGSTLAEIGRRLGVTESRACQIRTKGMRRLRTYLESQGVRSA